MIAAAPIRRLPQVVADAIAAGEVIERPASVVKELVENALDADATRIDIAIEGGGLVRIAVADDGNGIAADELELAVERHATSKIAVADDLARVLTLGFRGEALASIAAVSELRLTTRARGATGGATMHVRSGEVLSRTAAASGPGTRVEVCELFATSPARLRFLRSVATEGSAAVRVAADLAMTHPEVAFTCTNDGRTVLRTAGGTLREVIRAVIGVRAERDLLDVDAPGPIAVGGAISSPHAHRATRGGLVLIVNHRLVHNRALLAAVDESYRGLIPGGRHGYGVVVVEVSGAAVDVNVHPAKREVRFSDERAVFSAVQRACWAALRAAPALGADGHVPAGLAIGTLEIRDVDVDVTGRAASRLLGRPAGEHAPYEPQQQNTMAAPAPGQALPADGGARPGGEWIRRRHRRRPGRPGGSARRAREGALHGDAGAMASGHARKRRLPIAAHAGGGGVRTRSSLPSCRRA